MVSTFKTRTLWRLVKKAYAESAFDGEGAFRYGGRWNSRGQRVVYASGSLSLAALEVLVHLDPSAHLPEFSAVSIEVPAASLAQGEFSKLTDLASGFPWPTEQTRAWGDQWIQNASSAALEIPSTIVPTESNFLVNPAQLDFAYFKIASAQDFNFDCLPSKALAPLPSRLHRKCAN